MSLVLFPIFTFLMVMAADVVRTLYGPGYDQSLSVFRIYLALIPLHVMAWWSVMALAMRRPRINVEASTIVLVVNGALAIALVGPLGIAGAAIAGPVAVAAMMPLLSAPAARCCRLRSSRAAPPAGCGPDHARRGHERPPPADRRADREPVAPQARRGGDPVRGSGCALAPGHRSDSAGGLGAWAASGGSLA